MQKNMGKKGQKTAPVGQSVETVKPRRKRERARLEEWMYLEEKEIADFFRVITSKRDKAIFRLLYHHGLRAHEPGKLTLADFRERDHVLYIYRGKGSISRQHNLVDNAFKALKAYIRDERGTTPGPLFPSRQGGPITRGRLDQLMKEYCAAAGIRPEKAHCHALKHSCGTHLSERGASPQEIQDWLGHRESSSSDIYTHFSPRRRAASFEKHRGW